MRESVPEVPRSRDADLVEAARRGDRDAFGELVEQYQNLVCSIAFCITGSVSQSEELAQETFLVAWSRLSELKTVDSFRSWIYSIARRLSLYSQRTNRHSASDRDRSDVSSIASSDLSPLDRLIDHEEERGLSLALRRIPEIYRLPLVLFYREGNSTKKVATALGISEDNVRHRLMRGRKLLTEYVTSVLESVARKSRPNERFTAAVLLALGTLSAGTARAMPAARGSAPALVSGAVLLAIGFTVFVADAHRPTHLAQDLHEEGRLDRPRHQAIPLQLAAVGVGGQEKSLDDQQALAGVPDGVPVLGFDFEDGVLPESFSSGHVVPVSGRPDNRYAAMGTTDVRSLPTIDPDWGVKYSSWQTSVALVLKDIHYRESLVLSFDYWTEKTSEHRHGRSFYVEIYDGDRRSNYKAAFAFPVAERWTRVAIPLSSLTPNKPVGPMEAGDDLGSINIYGGSVGGSPFLIDNFRIVDRGDQPGAAAVKNDSRQ